jgi:hypothetical protein
MQAWFGFYAVVGGAAATFMGLLFVAVSINAAAILHEAHGHPRRLAEQAFQNYVAVLLVSLLALFPSLSQLEFGLVTLLVTAASGLSVLVRLCLTLSRPHDTTSRMQLLRRQTLSLLGFGMLIFAAVRMAPIWAIIATCLQLRRSFCYSPQPGLPGRCYWGSPA